MADVNGYGLAKQQDAMGTLNEQIDRLGMMRDAAEKRLAITMAEAAHADGELNLINQMQEALATIRSKFQHKVEATDYPTPAYR